MEVGEPGSAATQWGAPLHVVTPVADVLVVLDRCAGNHRGTLANRLFL